MKDRLQWYIALVPAIWCMGFARSMGSDLWWHVASGDWMRKTGEVVKTDPFSFTFYGKEWIHHEWLGDILLSRWVEILGMDTLVYFKWGMMLGIYLLLFRATVGLSEGGRFWPALATVAAAGCAAPYLDIRPQLYTFLGYSIVLNLFWAEGRWRWVIPPLVALWVNLHGGFIFALMVLGILLIPEVVDQPERRKSGIVLWFVTLLATVINPHGFSTTVFPFRYAFAGDNPYTEIAEWTSPFRDIGFQSRLFPYVLAVFSVVSVIWFLSQHRPTDLRMFAALLLGVLTLCMALKSRRFIPLFAMSAALVIGPGLTFLTARWKDRIPAWVGPLGVFLVGCLCVAPFPKGTRAFDYMVSTDRYPVDVCDFMELNNIEGNVFALYNFGGYLHLRGQGRWKVYIDGRADTVFDAEHYLDYLEVQRGGSMLEEIVGGSKADFVIWPHTHREIYTRLLETKQWRVVYADSSCILLGRPELDLGQLKEPEDGPYRLLSRAFVAVLSKNFEEAETLLERSLALHPTVRAYELLASMLGHTNQEEKRAAVKARWEAEFPKDSWFVKFFGP